MDKKLGMLDEAVNDEGGNHVSYPAKQNKLKPSLLPFLAGCYD
jgi:hypothetical protein